jgi:murein L,D-transpeptidase YafK
MEKALELFRDALTAKAKAVKLSKFPIIPTSSIEHAKDDAEKKEMWKAMDTWDDAQEALNVAIKAWSAYQGEE